MSINFKPLSKHHFPLLLKWLETPHVKVWWNPEIQWTADLIEDKYNSYVEGYVIINGEKKEIHAFIIYSYHIPIGYIQTYNAHDFLQDGLLKDLPKSLASFDILIGEKEYLYKDMGAKALKIFFEDFFTNKYKYVLASLDYKNLTAVNSYKKAGFTIIQEASDHENFVALKNIDADKAIKEFFFFYQNTYTEGNIEGCLNHFYYPCFLRLQDKSLLLEREEFKPILGKLMQKWLDRGLKDINFEILEISYFRPYMIQVHISWRFLNKQNKVFTSFDSIYQLVTSGSEDLKIFNLINFTAAIV